LHTPASSPSSSYFAATPPALPSFPPRRSSDLLTARPARGPRPTAGGSAPPAPAPAPPPAGRSVASRPAARGYRGAAAAPPHRRQDRKSTRLNSSHVKISYAVFCLKKKKRV